MSMTKKDYELIASVLNGLITSPYANCEGPIDSIATEIADKLANSLAAQDKRFKKEEFLRLCGVTD